MQTQCPHCLNSVELTEQAAFKHVECLSCGSYFSLLDEETISRGSAPTRTIGHFELIKEVGVGGFGTVWKARDTRLDRTVAIKVPRYDSLESDPEQFFREARASSSA